METLGRYGCFQKLDCSKEMFMMLALSSMLFDSVCYLSLAKYQKLDKVEAKNFFSKIYTLEFENYRL